MHEYLSWRAGDLDPYRLAAQTQVIRVVAMVAAKLGVDARRDRERQRIIEDLTRREFGSGDDLRLPMPIKRCDFGVVTGRYLAKIGLRACN